MGNESRPGWMRGFLVAGEGNHRVAMLLGLAFGVWLPIAGWVAFDAFLGIFVVPVLTLAASSVAGACVALFARGACRDVGYFAVSALLSCVITTIAVFGDGFGSLDLLVLATVVVDASKDVLGVALGFLLGLLGGRSMLRPRARRRAAADRVSTQMPE